MDLSDQYMQDLGDLWNPSVNDYDVSSSIGPISTEVQFLNIDDSTVVYKYQSRVRKEAKQRLKNAEVEILVLSPYDVKTIKVWVQREEKAADLFAYDIGRVEFAPRDIVFRGTHPLDNGLGTKNFYEIDLDAVYYDNPCTRRPVYKLAKTDMLNRNRFQVVVQVVFRDNSLSGEFISPAFYCCTQPKSATKRKTRCTNGTKQYEQAWNESEFYNNNQVIDYFEANEAVIGNLKVKGTLQSPKSKADIAYHFQVDQSHFQKTLTEGDIVGLVTNENDETSIVELSSKNMHTVVQVGVISRSAFLEGNIPAEKAVLTDKICMMGIVKVKVIGTIESGQRVYASKFHPGKAVPESSLVHVDDDILLGIAMEGSDQDDENLVRCFISILCGINANYSSLKAREFRFQTNADIEKCVQLKWTELKESFMSWCLIHVLFIVLLCIILFTLNSLT